MSLTHGIIAGILTAYGAAIVALTLGALPQKKGRAASKHAASDIAESDLPGVSVVIPFRNEESNLEALLRSIDDQGYKGPIEIIFVDDNSDDNGADIIKTYLKTNDRISIKIIDLDDIDIPFENIYQFKQLTTKQQAMDIGVVKSSYHLVAFTDADMILSPDWVESLVNTWLSTDADLVFGHTSVIAKDKRGTFESYQLEFLFAFAYAFSKLNVTGSCMGNNILVVKDSYMRCGGQRGAGYSIVEDRALLKLMRRHGCKTVAAEPFHTTARTYPAKSRIQFLNQMARWAGGGLRPGSGLFIAGLAMLSQNGILLLSTIGLYAQMLLPLITAAAPDETVIPLSISILAATNFFLTWLFLNLSFKKHRSPTPAWFYPMYYIFMMIETVVFGWMMLFKPKVAWKGRYLKT